MPTLEYDAIGTFTFQDEASFMNFMSDPDTAAEIIPDGARFSQLEKTFWVVRREFSLVEDGKPVVEI